MGFIVRTAVSTVFLALGVYVLFFVTLDGRSVASHLAEVWQSPVMQEKVGLVKRGVEDKLREELAKSAPAAHARLQGAGVRASHDELSDADRRSLAELVGRGAPTRP